MMKDIDGYEGLYQISNKGNVKILDRVRLDGKKYKGKMMKQHITRNYYSVKLTSHEGEHKQYVVNRLVESAFIDNPENKPFVNHIDGNKLNNCLDNLEWCTQSENVRHAHDNGLVNVSKGEDHYKCKLSDKDVEYIRQIYVPRHREFGCRALGRQLNVSNQLISSIVRGVHRAETFSKEMQCD